PTLYLPSFPTRRSSDLGRIRLQDLAHRAPPPPDPLEPVRVRPGLRDADALRDQPGGGGGRLRGHARLDPADLPLPEADGSRPAAADRARWAPVGHRGPGPHGRAVPPPARRPRLLNRILHPPTPLPAPNARVSAGHGRALQPSA